MRGHHILYCLSYGCCDNLGHLISKNSSALYQNAATQRRAPARILCGEVAAAHGALSGHRIADMGRSTACLTEPILTSPPPISADAHVDGMRHSLTTIVSLV